MSHDAQYVVNRPPLPETAFIPLPLGAIKPQGWLRRQLQIQAEGQTGRLDEFWPSLGPDSGWLGGDGESWERGPYYLDGLVPLAYLLEDERLIAKARKWIEWTLNSQDELGHFGPKTLTDWWPFGIILKVLTQYQEVTGDPRVIPLMEKFFTYMKRELPARHLHSWAIVRWADTALSVIWLYNRNGDPELLELADMVMRQGYDWSYHFADFAHTQKQAELFPMRTHVVNNGMGVKTPGVMYQLTKWEEHKQGAWQAIEMLDKYHGTAAGIFTGDEHYAGKDPVQGTELCAVVEYMFSLENLIQILGDSAFGDRLERICFNALPGTFDAKMWVHQYDQQANGVLCNVAKHGWTNNRDASNTYGLEPNYGCCTANFHQGWPKYVGHLWMATPDGGLAAAAYGPCQVTAKVRGGSEVVLEVETDYPFGEVIRIKVKTTKPVQFPMRLRIPAWTTEGAAVSVAGSVETVIAGSFHTIKREWADGDAVELKLPMPIRIERRYRDSATIHRGPLTFSLKIGEDWRKIGGDEPHADYEVWPTTPWNYGLLLDLENPEKSLTVKKKPIGDYIFGPEFAPIEIHAKGRRIPEWQIENNNAGPLPQSPVKSSEPVEDIVLIPYGCAKLRITEFPVVEG